MSFERDQQQEPTDLIRLKFLKCRSSARPQPIHLCYDDGTKGLVLAEPEALQAVQQAREQVATHEQMIEAIESLLGEEPCSQSELLKALGQRLSAGERTLRKRLKTLVEQEAEMRDAKGRPCRLGREQPGRSVRYRLIPLP